MTGIKCLLILTLWWSSTRADTRVSCVFMESCILPCSFQVGTEVVVRWIQVTPEQPHVHSYYYGQDQLTHQDQRFRGRTSLFKDQISRGNASLQLTGVKVQDQGMYRCYTSTFGGIKESFVHLKLDAPVHTVNIVEVENRITCSSGGIYPEPKLTWSTNPPSNPIVLQNTTNLQKTDQLLFNISSSLIVSDTDLSYSCTINTRSNWRRTTLLKPVSINGLDSETTIQCTASNASLKALVWRFNQSQVILTQTRPDVLYTVSEEWRQQVKGLSESFSLMLQNLSPHHEGKYTCELSDAEETLVTNTFLRMERGVWMLSGVALTAAAAAAITLLVLVLYFTTRKGQRDKINRGSNKDETQTEIKSKLYKFEEISPQNGVTLNQAPRPKEKKSLMCDV